MADYVLTDQNHLSYKNISSVKYTKNNVEVILQIGFFFSVCLTKFQSLLICRTDWWSVNYHILKLNNLKYYKVKNVDFPKFLFPERNQSHSTVLLPYTVYMLAFNEIYILASHPHLLLHQGVKKKRSATATF